MGDIIDYDPLLICPYNPSHEVSKSIMQYHLVKCAKSYPESEKETCPFNATHRIPRPEKKFHLENCPDRRVVESAKYQPEGEIVSGILHNYEKPSLPPSDENWDEFDCDSTYEPRNNISRDVLLRNLAGATRSERKKFRLEERHRVSNAENENEEEPAESAVTESVQLRLPKTSSNSLQGFIAGSLGMGRGVSVRIIPADSENTAGDFANHICFGRGKK